MSHYALDPHYTNCKNLAQGIITKECHHTIDGHNEKSKQMIVPLRRKSNLKTRLYSGAVLERNGAEKTSLVSQYRINFFFLLLPQKPLLQGGLDLFDRGIF